MNTKIIEGCMSASVEVNGVSINEYTLDELKDILIVVTDHVVDKATEDDMYELKTAIRNLIEMFGEHEGDDEPCDCCGDFVDTYTLDV